MSAGAEACREAAAAREVRPRCLRRLHRSWALGAHAVMVPCPGGEGGALGRGGITATCIVVSSCGVCMVSSGLAVSIYIEFMRCI